MEDSSPYHASSAPVAPSPAERVKLPAEITRPITIMWISALVLAAISLASMLFTLLPLLKNHNPYAPSLPRMVLAAGLLLDVVLYLGGAWGVRRRSRAVACLLFGYYLLGQTLMLVTGQRPVSAGLFMTIIMVFVMIRGTMETFSAHRYIARALHQPARPRLSDDPAFAPKPPAAE